jgi:hypothetical protein
LHNRWDAQRSARAPPGGITGQADDLRAALSSAKDTLTGWLTDLGVDRGTAETAKDDASSALSSTVPALLEGVGAALKRLSSLVVFLSFTALSLFFLLKDGPLIRRWAEGHMRVPRPTARYSIRFPLPLLRSRPQVRILLGALFAEGRPPTPERGRFAAGCLLLPQRGSERAALTPRVAQNGHRARRSRLPSANRYHYSR